MDEIAHSLEDVFLSEKLQFFCDVEVSLKKLKKRITSDTQSYNDGQKLIEALKEYGTTISTVPGMTEISECTERVARAHEIFTEMITDLHDTLRNQVTNAILQSIRELKQCRDLKGRLQQAKTEYETISRDVKSETKDKEKWNNSVMESKIRWENIAEEGIKRVHRADSLHNYVMAESLASLLQKYRTNFITGQEYMESIQPHINSFFKYAENRQKEMDRFAKIETDSPQSRQEKHKKRPFKRFGSKKSSKKELENYKDEERSVYDPEIEMEDNSSEPDDGEENDSIIFEVDPKTNEKEVRAGDIPNLVSFLARDSNQSDSFRIAFFLTFRTYSTPQDILSLLEKNYIHGTSDVKERILISIQYWMENHQIDFLKDRQLCNKLRLFLSLRASKDKPQLAVTLGQVHNDLLKSMSSKNFNILPGNSIPRNYDSSLSFKDMDPLILARQLTLIESKLFCAITKEELLHKNWNQDDKQTLAPNIINVTNHFNKISRWVVNEIVSNFQLKARIETLKKFIQMLQHLRNLNNFSGVMEVLAGVNSSPVRRLKSTWKEIGESEMRIVEDIERLMNHKSSYRSYRSTLNSAKKPVVPFIGVFLTDLTFIEDGNPKFLHNNLVNFTKCQRTSNVVQEILNYKSQYSQLKIDESIQSWLHNVQPIGEEEAYTQSTRIEPRDTSEAFENLLIEEDRLRKQVAELQVRVDDLKSLQVRQTKTVSLLSDQVREQRKLIQKQKRNTVETNYKPLPDDLSEAEAIEFEKKFQEAAHIEFCRPGRNSTDEKKKAKYKKGKALFDFIAENADELSFKKGDIVTILSQDESFGGQGWWVGKLGNIQGVFPSDYITIL